MMGEETAGRLLASAESGTFGSVVAGYAIESVMKAMTRISAPQSGHKRGKT
jgi:hypothetical protein